MWMGLPPSSEELERMDRANRKYNEMFSAEHPFLSLLSDLLYGFFVCGFFLVWLIFMIYWLFFCP